MRLLAVSAAALGPLAAAAAQMPVTQLPPANPDDPVERLSRYLRVLSTNPNSLDALRGAGRAALDVGDPSAAVGFFARAQEAAPRDGRVKAGLAAALVQLEQPKDALKLFGEAETLGVSPAEFGADRGLAYDLRGDGRRAQADYRAALALHPADDETVRRLALSLAMSGDRAGALAVLDPLLRRQDRASWRASTFVLAMTGDKAGADMRVGQLMGQTQAQAMRPFLDRLAALGPAEQAAAVHFGHFPSTGGNGRDATRLAAATPVRAPERAAAPVRTATPERALIPSGPALGTATASSGVTAATASIAPVTASPGFTDAFAIARTADGGATRRRPGQADPALAATPTAIVATPPAMATATPTARAPADAVPPARTALAAPAAAVTPPSTTAALVPAEPPRTTVQMKRSDWATPELPATPIPNAPMQGATGALAAAPAPSSVPVAGVLAPAAADTVTPARPEAVPTAPARLALVETPVPPQAQPAASVPAPTAATIVETPVASAPPSPVSPSRTGPVRAAPARADAARSGARPAATLPGRGRISRLELADAADTDAQPAVTLPGRGKLSHLRLADDAGDVPDAAAERAAALPGRGRIARLKLADGDEDGVGSAPRGTGSRTKLAQNDVAAGGSRRARGTKAAADVDDDAGAARSSEAKLTPREARAKAAADAKAAKDSKAKATKEADAKRAAKAAPERYWVQVAGGANKSDLPKAWAQARAAHPQELAGRTPHTTPLRFTNRLLVGPFKSADEAQAFVNRTAKTGWTTFTFTSAGGQKVDPVGTK